MTKKQTKTIWTIFIASLVQTALSFAFIPLMELITERNLINDILTIFGYAGWTDLGDFVILIFFVASLVQTILSYIAVSAELNKLGFESKKPYEIDNRIAYFILVSIILSIPLLFIYKGLSYLMVGFSLFFTLFLLLKNVAKKEIKNLIVFGVALLLNIFVFAMFNRLLSFGAILLIEFAPLVVAINSLLDFKK